MVFILLGMSTFGKGRRGRKCRRWRGIWMECREFLAERLRTTGSIRRGTTILKIESILQTTFSYYFLLLLQFIFLHQPNKINTNQASLMLNIAFSIGRTTMQMIGTANSTRQRATTLGKLIQFFSLSIEIALFWV